MLNEIEDDKYDFIDYLAFIAKEDGKNLGEQLEMILPLFLRKNGISSQKILTRNQEEDIIINGNSISLKSYTGNAFQISTCSDSHKERIVFKEIANYYNYSFDSQEEESSLEINDLSFIKERFSAYNVNDLLLCAFKDLGNGKYDFLIGFFSFKIFLERANKAFFEKAKTHSPIIFYNNNDYLFSLKDDTGKMKANALQRGLWIEKIKDIKDLKNKLGDSLYDFKEFKNKNFITNDKFYSKIIY